MYPDPLQQLARHLRRFTVEHDWEQFHASKNLADQLGGSAKRYSEYE